MGIIVLASLLREIQEPPHVAAEKVALAVISQQQAVLHFADGEEFSSNVSLIRENRKKQGEIIVELTATESSRITLYIPLDEDATAYAKVWPR